MGIVSFFETIFDKIKKLFEDIDAAEPEIEKAISITLNVLTPILGTVISLTAGSVVGSEVENIIIAVNTELTNVQNILNQAGPTPTITTLLSAIVANLTSLLQGAFIKDPVVLAKVEMVINVVVGELQAIIKVL